MTKSSLTMLQWIHRNNMVVLAWSTDSNQWQMRFVWETPSLAYIRIPVSELVRASNLRRNDYPQICCVTRENPTLKSDNHNQSPSQYIPGTPSIRWKREQKNRMGENMFLHPVWSLIRADPWFDFAGLASSNAFGELEGFAFTFPLPTRPGSVECDQALSGRVKTCSDE